MTAQTDLFADGSADSVPAWQDPGRVADITIAGEIDRDHVGESLIGRVGNNRMVYVVRVVEVGGEVLRSETFTRRADAGNRVRDLWRAIDRNRQARLF